ncbi:uncharacterized protein CCR75_006192 [Bremia lactucae]|uniref:Uncharacterized protein n=1 Tax=Bremia lactucae TaxID=4779 RepID=A0A976IBQ6_BRELC|nr:hypothetical protein CCR75_006192 [Bremia lactucae]
MEILKLSQWAGECSYMHEKGLFIRASKHSNAQLAEEERYEALVSNKVVLLKSQRFCNLPMTKG